MTEHVEMVTIGINIRTCRKIIMIIKIVQVKF